MAYDRTEKKIQPRTADEFKQIEDRLAQIQHEFRELRKKMHDANMESVDLAIGTFLYHLDEMEPLSKRYLAKCDEQRFVLEQRQKRQERAKEPQAKKAKK